MAWIELHQSLVSHPKTKRLSRRLSVSIPAAIGHVTCLWCWCIEYAQDGDLSRYDVEELADAAMWTGDAATFVNALVEAGFLVRGETLLVHHWHDYAGRLVDRRAANAKRMRDARSKPVQGTCAARAGATVPNPTVPNQHDQTGDRAHAHEAAPPLLPIDSIPMLDQEPGSAAIPETATPEGAALAGPSDQGARPASSVKKAARALEVGRNAAAWEFSEDDLAALALAALPVGIAARELPAAIGRALAKRDGPEFERWFAKEPGTVAAWCQVAVAKAQQQKGPTPPVAYVAGIIGDRLAGNADLLAPDGKSKVVQLREDLVEPAAMSARWW